ncbi:MAG: Ribulose-phosphate 3-epimerase [Candidatus Jorgensenbacteria bacterium GW2011_GWA1_48_13]|uniref:Ribulose-phosphate 3-epimerase n=1 Tax=Candidatus Jorgensenbacteria bacterium GW2011_GWB1_50_10 TaxID=1618665 RepID=A0A0G1W7T7_9BACT|nr:MAG: Ribulose-phosphate 3-epimerase [Candidatus Jorgensenbacteria bacterium GW2011_GWA1_48_13]KKW14836.1 MAG: Ribulose-phosphate 3-epimerase [Candidatus Jorgensenbacteria bacterium GW2011_GWB1_50_10]
MQIIPSINETDFEEIRRKIGLAASFAEWVHFDVSDGEFTDFKNWNEPEKLLELSDELSGIRCEVHLMVAEPQAEVERWLSAGAARIIVHAEMVEDGWPMVIDKMDNFGAELGIAVNPETPLEILKPYLKAVPFIQLLAVKPGPSGQKFNETILSKIRIVKRENPETRVEIDGGINLETAKLAKKAGADILVSGSYIWQSPEPEKAYEALKEI